MTLTLRAVTLAVAGALPFAAAASQYGKSQDQPTAQQSEQSDAQGRSFQSLDTNGDGQVSQREWEQADRDQDATQGDGGGLVVLTITPVERRMMDEQRRESMFRALDRNGDGTIAPAEAGLNVQLMSAFAKLDKDQNAKIDRQEFVQVHIDDGTTQGEQASGAGAMQDQQASTAGTSQDQQASAAGTMRDQQASTAGERASRQEDKSSSQ